MRYDCDGCGLDGPRPDERAQRSMEYARATGKLGLCYGDAFPLRTSEAVTVLCLHCAQRSVHPLVQCKGCNYFVAQTSLHHEVCDECLRLGAEESQLATIKPGLPQALLQPLRVFYGDARWALCVHEEDFAAAFTRAEAYEAAMREYVRYGLVRRKRGWVYLDLAPAANLALRNLFSETRTVSSPKALNYYEIYLDSLCANPARLALALGDHESVGDRNGNGAVIDDSFLINEPGAVLFAATRDAAKMPSIEPVTTILETYHIEDPIRRVTRCLELGAAIGAALQALSEDVLDQCPPLTRFIFALRARTSGPAATRSPFLDQVLDELALDEELASILIVWSWEIDNNRLRRGRWDKPATWPVVRVVEALARSRGEGPVAAFKRARDFVGEAHAPLTGHGLGGSEFGGRWRILADMLAGIPRPPLVAAPGALLSATDDDLEVWLAIADAREGWRAEVDPLVAARLAGDAPQRFERCADLHAWRERTRQVELWLARRKANLRKIDEGVDLANWCAERGRDADVVDLLANTRDLADRLLKNRVSWDHPRNIDHVIALLLDRAALEYLLARWSSTEPLAQGWNSNAALQTLRDFLTGLIDRDPQGRHGIARALLAVVSSPPADLSTLCEQVWGITFDVPSSDWEMVPPRIHVSGSALESR